MAGKNIEGFFEEVQSSTDLQGRLEALQSSCGNDLMKVYATLAREMGFDFTEAQLQAALEEKSADMVPEGPLSDEQLESVAAAGGCRYCLFTQGSYCFFTK